MSKITISSLNVRGLVNNDKRGRNISLAQKENFSVYMLQEAKKSTKNSFGVWAAKWGYTALFSGAASNKAGIAILFNNNFSFKILKRFCDKEGKRIIIDLEVDELTLTICNIYAPNKDDPFFIIIILLFLKKCCLLDVMKYGDFNLVLDILEDKRGEYQPHIRSL